MKQLEIQVINVIPDQQHAADEEDKISSSSARKRLLGTLLRPPLKVSCATGSIFINMFVYCTIIIQETDFLVRCISVLIEKVNIFFFKYLLAR